MLNKSAMFKLSAAILALVAGGALAVAWVNTQSVFGAKISLQFALLRPRFEDGILISYSVARDTVVVPPEFSMLTLRALVALPAGGALLRPTVLGHCWLAGALAGALAALAGWLAC